MFSYLYDFSNIESVRFEYAPVTLSGNHRIFSYRQSTAILHLTTRSYSVPLYETLVIFPPTMSIISTPINFAININLLYTFIFPTLTVPSFRQPYRLPSSIR